MHCFAFAKFTIGESATEPIAQFCVTQNCVLFTGQVIIGDHVRSYVWCGQQYNPTILRGASNYFVWCRDAGTAKAVVLVEEIRLQQSGLQKLDGRLSGLQKYYVRSDPKLTKILVGLHLFNLICATITRNDC